MQDVLAGQARWAVVCADARAALASLPDNSVDSVCTDPPYALTDRRGGSKGFMSAVWDNGLVAHDPAFWAEVLRVAKSGAFLLAFGGTRTYHRLACAIEDAGWECRDMIMWHYGSGFPKSKSCLKPAHEPILLAKAPGPLQPLQIDACRVATGDSLGGGRLSGHTLVGAGWDRPWMHDAALREGYAAATQEKVAHAERLGRWPPNTLFSHVGGPDGCQPAGVRRVRGSHDTTGVWGSRQNSVYSQGWAPQEPIAGYTDADGYESVDAWTCVDGCPVAELDRQAGPRTSRPGSTRGASRHIYGNGSGFTDATGESVGYRDISSAVSRFFPTFAGAPDPADVVPFRYEPKASRCDRNAGCEGLPAQRNAQPGYDTLRKRECRRCGSRAKAPGPAGRWPNCAHDDWQWVSQRDVGIKGGPATNTHPTVKPTALMAWLCKLVTPEDGVVLDCFGGSGSTAVAAVRCGMRAIIIEQDAHYCAIARARIAHEQEQHSGPLFAGIAAQR